MSSQFEKALNDALAQQAAADRAQQLYAQEAAAQQRRVRAIAEPYLSTLAKDVRQKLIDMRVPLSYYNLRQCKLWWERPWFKWSRGYWPVTRDFGLYLTEDGYFVKDISLPGPQGFEKLLLHHVHLDISSMDPRWRYSSSLSHEYGDLYVINSTPPRIWISKYLGDGDSERHDLEPLIAKSIVDLSKCKS